MGLKRRMHVKPEFSLAAMIDVIFLLLMFFMLTSNFVTTNSLNLQLPSSSSSAPMASTSLSVSINKSGQYYVGKERVSGPGLEPVLKSKVALEKKDPKDVTVTIAAEQGVPIEDVVFVLDIANRLKVKTILATNPKEEGK
ncbi:MAG: biopolymer transporter ExbD [Saprospiraceae bacterium]|nr:biopolymer transporter ExbD [Saprospiraceae bacterium]MCB0574108.1 biopolymer transporter ExbD [Saprospiraceae bacterium]MCB9306397.1 biopolymer transporter ExbD [Lewinellaceae bacterium]MCB9353665.1 biopolymer transporter ExbD [Lewinellaceae bacterium]